MSQLFPGVQAGNGAEVASAVAVATQSLVATTRAVVAGTVVQIPTDGLKPGSRYRARIVVSKTAAGVATSTVDVFTTPRDSSPVVANATARVSLTKPAGTADIATGVYLVELVVRTIAVSGVLYGDLTVLNGAGAALGVLTTPVAVVSAAGAGFDNTDLAGGYIGVAVTTGASEVVTVQEASADLFEPGTP